MQQEEAVELFSFVWWVPDAGFIWQEDAEAQRGGDGDSPFLLKNPRAKEEKSYVPVLFDEPGDDRNPESPGLLFNRFAALKPSREAIEAFANKQGWLGVQVPIRFKDNQGRVKKGYGEALERWVREISDLKDAVALWKWLNWGGRQVSVEWGPGNVSISISRPSPSGQISRSNPRRILFYGEEDERLFRLFDRQHRDPALAVRAALFQEINRKLAGYASPCLLLDKRGRPLSFVRPRNLLAAIWVQFYQAVVDWRRIRPCTYCHELMDVTGGRSTKRAHTRCVHNAKVRRYQRKLLRGT